jgi:GNAT superfamily N-acetyltransferase
MNTKATTDTETALEPDLDIVRALAPGDLDKVVAIDAAAAGRRRPLYFQLMFERAIKQTSLQVSLAAEMDGRVVGFLIASLYYGEFGVSEPAASLEAIGVEAAYRGRRVGHALMRQLRLNLAALGVRTLRTEVSWDNFDLLAFFSQEGFRPASRLCLERSLDATAPDPA